MVFLESLENLLRTARVIRKGQSVMETEHQEEFEVFVVHGVMDSEEGEPCSPRRVAKSSASLDLVSFPSDHARRNG
jgi:hypothetical protein